MSPTRQNKSIAKRKAELAPYLVFVESLGYMVSTHPDCNHGTIYAYNVYSCRCSRCREAKRVIQSNFNYRRKNGWRL